MRGIARAKTSLAIVAGACVLIGGVAQSASAATFEVTRTDDPVPNGCAAGDCSLREAVIAASGAGGKNVLRVKPGATYTLEIPGDSGPTVGDLDVGGLTSIQMGGTRSKPVTIDANGATTFNRAFFVGGSLSLKHVVVKNGVAPVGGDSTARGGGIRVGPMGELRMTDSRVVENEADQDAPLNGFGGGIQSAGTVTLKRVVLEDNSADGTAGFGGGFHLSGGSATIVDSAVRSNDAEFGGGLAGDGGTAELVRSDVDSNDADASGGGIFVINGPDFTLTNVTVYFNSAGSGGNLRARDATIRLRNSTVTEGLAGTASGISVQDDPGGADGAIRLANSLVADNGQSGETDCVDQTGGQVISAGYNLISDMGAGACSVLAQPGDQFGNTGPGVPEIDSGLDVDVFNGGPLLPGASRFITRLLRKKSPAIDAGAPEDYLLAPCEGKDARGVPRSLGKRCDIGAYERVHCGGTLVNRVGTNRADHSKTSNLEPSGDADGYLGLDGPDRLVGGAGDDGICGGSGDDVLKGGDGKDVLDGGPGRDVCIGGPGNDKTKGCEVERSIP